jgi:hypothetical protein
MIVFTPEQAHATIIIIGLAIFLVFVVVLILRD